MSNLIKFVIVTTLMSACASDVDGNNIHVEEKSSTAINSGDSCGNSCIWSAYAVDNMIQEAQSPCGGRMCACVVEGDAHTLCEDGSGSKPQDLTVPSTQVSPTEMDFLSQYDNQYAGPSTCQNTSVAMVLNYYEKPNRITPDQIYLKFGKDYAQSPAGLNSVYSYYATKSQIKTNTSASPEFLKSELSQGKTAIVHGYFTRSGHVLVVRSFDGVYYHVNDPAGVWDSCFKCGYSGSYNGVTLYHKTSFEAAVFTSDGYSYLPGWIHIVSKN